MQDRSHSFFAQRAPFRSPAAMKTTTTEPPSAVSRVSCVAAFGWPSEEHSGGGIPPPARHPATTPKKQRGARRRGGLRWWCLVTGLQALLHLATASSAVVRLLISLWVVGDGAAAGIGCCSAAGTLSHSAVAFRRASAPLDFFILLLQTPQDVHTRDGLGSSLSLSP